MLNAKSELERSSQVPAPELERRISALIGLFRSRTEAASVARMSTDQLARYEKGGTPSFAPLAKLALAKGVRLEWLATGEGPMLASEAAAAWASQPERMNLGILAIACGLLNDLLQAMGGRLSGDDYAAALVDLVDLLRTNEKAVPAKVVELSRYIKERTAG